MARADCIGSHRNHFPLLILYLILNNRRVYQFCRIVVEINSSIAFAYPQTMLIGITVGSPADPAQIIAYTKRSSGALLDTRVSNILKTRMHEQLQFASLVVRLKNPIG